MGSHCQILNMEQGLLLTTLLQACTGQPFLLDLFHPRQSGDRADTSQYHAPHHSYGVPHSSPCPTYTTTTIPPPTYHHKDKPKAPFPDVLGFLKSIPEGIHNIFKASPNPQDDYGVPCTVPQSSYSPPEVTDYTPPVVDDYGPPEVPGYNGDHGGDISINERGLVPDGKA